MRRHRKEKWLAELIQIRGLVDRAALLIEELRKEISNTKASDNVGKIASVANKAVKKEERTDA